VVGSFDEDLDVFGPERRAWVEGLILLALGTAGITSFFAARLGAGIAGVLFVIAGLASMRLRLRRTILRQRISADATGLSIDGRMAFRREVIQAGVFQPHELRDHASVRLLGTHGQTLFEARVPNKAAANRLLRALGVDTKSRRVELKGLSPIVSVLPRAMGLVSLLAMVLIAALGGYASLALWLLPMLVPLVVLAATPSTITVGVDGVLVEWLTRKRFIPIAEIETVHKNGPTGLLLRLTSGEKIVTGGASTQREVAARDRDATVARVNEILQIARAKRKEPHVDLADLLRRAGRTTKEWADALRKARGDDGGGGYRSAMRSEDLLRVIEDTAAPEDARAGAAFLLRAPPEDEIQTRVRIAAEATASPALRIALEAAAEAESEEEEEEVLASFARHRSES